jgi:hypothetical protein
MAAAAALQVIQEILYPPEELAVLAVEERAQTLRQDQHLLMVQLTQAAVAEELLAQETLDQLNQPVPVDLEL